MKIWLDDVRPALAGYTLATNFEEFKALLESSEKIEAISFDYDLGEYRNGMHCAQMVCQRARRGQIDRIEWDVHSTHPSAVDIIQLMERADDFWSQNEK